MLSTDETRREAESIGERPRVVVAGGGIAALEGVLALEEMLGSQVELTLLSADRYFHYAPLAVAEAFNEGCAYRLELKELLRERPVEVRLGRMQWVDPESRQIGTANGERLEYEALLVAIGAVRRGVLPGANTFVGRSGVERLRLLVERARAGALGDLIFAVPAGVAWTLPAYELALMTAGRLVDEGHQIDVSVVSPEQRPLEIFGEEASELADEILRSREVLFFSGTPVRFEGENLVMADRDPIYTEATVALPQLFPAEIEGLPQDVEGFLPVDDRCRVAGLERVYAAGDATGTAVKMGGIAAQQADAAARAIAADLDLGPEPEPFRPALSGVMLAGPVPRYREVIPARTGGVATEESVSLRPSWPIAKVAGRRLAPFLAKRGIPLGAPPGTVAIDIVADGSASLTQGTR